MPNRSKSVVALALTCLCLLAATRPAAAAEPETKPATKPSTYHDLSRDAVAYHRKNLVQAYRDAGKRDPKWDAAAERLLDAVALYFASEPLPPPIYDPPGLPITTDLVPLAQAVVETKCDDPLVQYACAYVLREVGRDEEALPLLRKAVPGMAAGKYPLHPQVAAAFLLSQLTAGKEAFDVRHAAHDRAVALCTGKLSAIERRMVLDVIWEKDRPLGPDQVALAKSLSKSADVVDPWVRCVYTGKVSIELAWAARGGGWADTVTPEGWENFRTHMTTARNFLTTAYKTAPELPEAPTQMITVAMGAGDHLNERPRDWYDRALAAQSDYEPAFIAYVRGPLLPRWGGSYEAMLDLGREGLAKPDYDRTVAWQLVTAVKHVGWDAKKPFAPLKDPAVYAAVVDLCEGYAKHHGASTAAGDFYRSAHAAAAWQSGRAEEGGKVLREMLAAGRKPNEAAFAYFDQVDPKLEISTALAATGPHATALAAARSLVADGPATLKALRAALDKLPADDLSRPAVAAWAEIVDADIKYEAGEWVSVQPTGPFMRGWNRVEGVWHVAAKDGALVGRYMVWPGSPPAEGAVATIVYDPVQVGRAVPDRFELAGNIWFIPAPAGGLTLAGPVSFNPDTLDRGVFVLDKQRKTAGLAAGGIPSKAPVKDGVGFVLRVEGRRFTLFVDGKQIGDPIEQPKLEAGATVLLGVSVYGYAGPGGIKYTNLRVRKAPREPAAK